ncbi:cyclin-dependent kinase 9-like [Papaver somniferum]|uniref:cyclin-dependent kinase 9-like n=1 Tax=Papaver somniferum TaxID=3469 RepID=UPI000E6FC171|nr:cyclin-dependent kinase 9-like [Papaver somniferum]
MDVASTNIMRVKRTEDPFINGEKVPAVNLSLAPKFYHKEARMVDIQKQASQPGSGVVLSGRKDAVFAVLGPEKRGRALAATKEDFEMATNRILELETQFSTLMNLMMSRDQLQPNLNSEGLELSVVSREAIHGWIPLRAESFEKLKKVKCYMHKLLSVLEHCHSRGIMHIDIKGSNLLVSDDEALKIAYFGLENFVSVGHIQPLTSRVVSLWYRPPELLLGSTSYGQSVDLWSADLGSRGRTEFAGEGSKEVQQKLQESIRGSVVVVATEVQCRERGSGDGSDCRPEYKEKRGFQLQISEIQ